jgi:hypothetical protein
MITIAGGILLAAATLAGLYVLLVAFVFFFGRW